VISPYFIAGVAARRFRRGVERTRRSLANEDATVRASTLVFGFVIVDYLGGLQVWSRRSVGHDQALAQLSCSRRSSSAQGWWLTMMYLTW